MTLTMTKGDTKQWYINFWLGRAAYVVTGHTIRFTFKEFLSDLDSAAKISKVTGGESAATVTGTVAENYNISGSNNQFSVKVDGGGTQTVTLTSGATRTAAQVAADIDAGTTGITTSVSSGKVVLTSQTAGTNSSIEIVTTANSSYVTLGFTIGVYRGVSGIVIQAHPKTLVNNRALLTIDPQDTSGLPFKGMNGFFDIQIKDASQAVYTTISGPFEVRPDVRNEAA